LPGGDRRGLGELDRRLDAADVDLLAHEEFVELSLDALVNGFDVC
jgi:hypothetical protein